ncbi:MAG: hypothetical protein ACM3RX_01105, partial [Methanococcaceae archaeon]
MGEIWFVFPNLGKFNSGTSRGGLLNRWENAREYGFDFVEVPANFVKKTEADFLGLKKCEFLTIEAINKMYPKNGKLPKDTKYILHTDFKCPLKWYSESWVEQFIKMNVDIVKRIELLPTMIEIHPGKRPNTYQDIAESAVNLLNTFKDEFKVKPTILIENRTEHVISNGIQMKEFWDFFIKNYPLYQKYIGFVVDFSAMYTQVTNDYSNDVNSHFIDNIELIPDESIKGCHIHKLHKVPTINDDVPWLSVFNKIINLNNDLILNLEVLSSLQSVLETKKF